MAARINYTAAQVEAALYDYYESHHLTVKEICAKHKMSKTVLRYYRRKLENEQEKQAMELEIKTLNDKLRDYERIVSELAILKSQVAQLSALLGLGR